MKAIMSFPKKGLFKSGRMMYKIKVKTSDTAEMMEQTAEGMVVDDLS